MQKLILLCVVAVVAMAAARPEDTYTDKFDTIDLNEILENRRLLEAYVNCVLEKGKCSPEGKELKAHIKEALENNCGKCTEKQREGTRKIIGHLINKEAEFWAKLTAKYDPDHKYVTKYEEELKTVKA